MAAFVILWLLMDICWRFGCREAFEYKQHKGSLKNCVRNGPFQRKFWACIHQAVPLRLTI